ncbi:MAG: trimeric intracellular cation channel family protein [Oscillospiraceae bacterium]|nr:trimeric intracellular cation channel family protein [Oscillospiraceae bacterium]
MELNGDTLFFIVEILGTIAFAISGAMIGIDRELDLFGVIFMGCITACGGGMLRDVILGQTPPQSFINAVYLSSSAVTSLLVFLYSWRRHKRLTDLHAIGSITLDIDMPLNVIDAAGLGIFSVIGVQNTINAGYGENVFFCVFLGACTGVGGGMLRDMMSNATPAIFRKHIYAIASIIGAICYYYLMPYGRGMAIVVTTVLVIVLRVLASKYRWSLPKIETSIFSREN